MSSLRATHWQILPGLVGLAFAFAAVGPAQSANNTPEARTDPSRAVTALIGDAACDNDAQCKTVAVGAKACGGPEYYAAWSTKRTDAAALRQAAGSELTAHNPHVNPGMRSTCVIVADPGAYCATAAGQAPSGARTQGGFCKLRGVDRGGGRVD